MRVHHIYLSLAVILAALILISTFDRTYVEAVYQGQDRSEIIKFSHRIHADVGIECLDCHSTVPQSRDSRDNLLAMKVDCAACHDVSSDCMLCHVSETVQYSFVNPPRDLYFNHSLHYEKLGIGCESCHKNVDQVDFAGPEQMPIKADCMSCHDGGQASMDCESCHMSTKTLIPASHMAANFTREHKRFVRAGAMEAECASCHMTTFCQDCHDAAGLTVSDSRPIRTSPLYSPEGAGKGTVSSARVHDLNYRFTHGIDARAKQSQCQTCHSVESFCADCHFEGGGVALGGFKPESHQQPGFVMLSGTGGGHAELARRDIENCMTCHDLQGRDPSCLLCHGR
jgi:hypothetical protein